LLQNDSSTSLDVSKERWKFTKWYRNLERVLNMMFCARGF